MAIRGSVFINNQCGIMLLQLGHLLSNVWQPDVESFQSALLNFIDSVLGKKKKYSLPEFFVCFQLTPDYLKLLKDSGFPWTGWPSVPFRWRIPTPDFHQSITHWQPTISMKACSKECCPALVTCGYRKWIIPLPRSTLIGTCDWEEREHCLTCTLNIPAGCWQPLCEPKLKPWADWCLIIIIFNLRRIKV